MIKNVVFDFGQVLVHFEPEYMTSRYVSDEEDIRLVSGVVFDRLYWDRLDAGTISDAEVVSESLKRLPERLWEAAEKVYYNWVYNIPEIDGMKNLLGYIREKYGVKTYLISNISHYFADHSDEISILDGFDGCIFSSRCGLSKPDKRIFEHICKTYGILPEETVFVDDNEGNVKAAEEMGIKTYLFKKDARCLKEWFDSVLPE